MRGEGPSLEFFGATGVADDERPGDDSYLLGGGADANLFAVADGLGRRGSGKLASSIAVDALENLGSAVSLEEGIQRANRDIRDAYEIGRKLGMATTVVAVRFVRAAGELTAEVAHVGDSRAYLLRGQWLLPLTEDHSLMAELVRSETITPEQAADHPRRNVITRALGIEEEARVDKLSVSVFGADRVLLCSDGLTDVVPETEVCRILRDAHDAEAAVEKLVAAALEAHTTGGVTAVVVDVGGVCHEGNGTPETGAGASVFRLHVPPTSPPGPRTALRRSYQRGRTA